MRRHQQQHFGLFQSLSGLQQTSRSSAPDCGPQVLLVVSTTAVTGHVIHLGKWQHCCHHDEDRLQQSIILTARGGLVPQVSHMRARQKTQQRMCSGSVLSATWTAAWPHWSATAPLAGVEQGRH